LALIIHAKHVRDILFPFAGMTDINTSRKINLCHVTNSHAAKELHAAIQRGSPLPEDLIFTDTIQEACNDATAAEREYDCVIFANLQCGKIVTSELGFPRDFQMPIGNSQSTVKWRSNPRQSWRYRVQEPKQIQITTIGSLDEIGKLPTTSRENEIRTASAEFLQAFLAGIDVQNLPAFKQVILHESLRKALLWLGRELT
jgi:hypothetical protein